MTRRVLTRSIAEWLFRLMLLVLAIFWVVAQPFDARHETAPPAAERGLP